MSVPKIVTLPPIENDKSAMHVVLWGDEVMILDESTGNRQHLDEDEVGQELAYAALARLAALEIARQEGSK